MLLLFVSWGGSALATWLYTLSFTLGPPLTSLLLQKTQPVFALILAGWTLQERRAPGFWAWCALALAGAYALVGVTTAPSLESVRWQQAGCAVGAALLWGGATVAGRALTRSLSAATLAGARFALAVPALALLVWATRGGGGHGAASAGGPGSWGLLLAIVLLPDLLGMALYYRGLRDTPASVATLAELCYPLTALVIGVSVQHARLGAGQWLGLTLLVGSVLRLAYKSEVRLEARERGAKPASAAGSAWADSVRDGVRAGIIRAESPAALQEDHNHGSDRV
jgi:drug/metabolite transporter (DMT)-like permease